MFFFAKFISKIDLHKRTFIRRTLTVETLVANLSEIFRISMNSKTSSLFFLAQTRESRLLQDKC